MKLSVLALAIATVVSMVSTNVAQAAEELKLDLEKSKIGFVGGKPDGTKHEGGFKKFEAKAMADFEDATKSSLSIKIKTESLWSDAEKLTAHLKNPDFFDVRKYPEAVFTSTSIEPHGEGSGSIKGKLKMLAKEVEIEFPIKVEMDGSMIKISGEFKIDRTKWGMNYGEGKINKDVELNVELAFKR